MSLMIKINECDKKWMNEMNGCDQWMQWTDEMYRWDEGMRLIDVINEWNE